MRKRDLASRGNRTEELIEAAIGVIREDGAAASMERIALAAGVTKPILYKHFGDKAGIYETIAARYLDELRSELIKSMRPGASPAETLRRTIDTYLAVIEREPQIYRFLTREARLSVSDPGAPVESFIRQLAGEVTIVISDGLRASGADLGAAEPIGYGITGMVQLAGDWWIERQTMSRDRMTDYITDLIWHGLSAMLPNPERTAARLQAG